MLMQEVEEIVLPVGELLSASVQLGLLATTPHQSLQSPRKVAAHALAQQSTSSAISWRFAAFGLDPNAANLENRDLTGQFGLLHTVLV